uniref:BZIP domain-containing protein n=1 Tax=Rhabditophanes sp. KR3021 TaxID=114890 RepID=A0AC35TSA3_9BILA
MVTQSLHCLDNNNQINQLKFVHCCEKESPSTETFSPEECQYTKQGDSSHESAACESEYCNKTLICSDYECDEEHSCDSRVEIKHLTAPLTSKLNNKCCQVQRWIDGIIDEVRAELAAEKCECTNIKHCTHERVSLKQLSKHEILERKKYQNRQAAAKYRQKKKVNSQLDKASMDVLMKKNKELKGVVYNLETQIYSAKTQMAKLKIAVP